jgi:hypothetical protein
MTPENRGLQNEILLNPFEDWLRAFRCSSYQELYSAIEYLAKCKIGLDEVPFPLSALENTPVCDYPEIDAFITQCAKAHNSDNSESDAIKLIEFLKENHPEESYGNPILPDKPPTKTEMQLMVHIFYNGIDLPGSLYNPFGHLQYFSSFFIDMFFGNYTEFNDYIKSQSKEEIQKALTKREGYCQYSPIYAPIRGLRLIDVEGRINFTGKHKQEIRSMYSGCNENKHLKIMKKLVKLGADVNAIDIYGFTPLHHALYYRNEGMVSFLLRQGADPNSVSRRGWSPMSTMVNATLGETDMILINILIQYNARVSDTSDINDLRTTVEKFGSKDLAAKVREAYPREKEVCEKCLQRAPKQCGACGKVYYCTPDCQKLDWKYHMVSCKKM